MKLAALAVVAFAIPSQLAAGVALLLSVASVLISMDANRRSREAVNGLGLGETSTELDRQRAEIAELGTQAPPDDD